MSYPHPQQQRAVELPFQGRKVPAAVARCFDPCRASAAFTLRFFTAQLLLPGGMPKLCFPLLQFTAATPVPDGSGGSALLRQGPGCAGASFTAGLHRDWKED
jgi:hypothetical protein